MGSSVLIPPPWYVRFQGARTSIAWHALVACCGLAPVHGSGSGLRVRRWIVLVCAGWFRRSTVRHGAASHLCGRWARSHSGGGPRIPLTDGPLPGWCTGYVVAAATSGADVGRSLPNQLSAGGCL